MLSWGTLYLASEWVIRLVMLFYVPQRRSPAAARGWLLLIFFLPWVGLVLYAVVRPGPRAAAAPRNAAHRCRA